MPRIIIAATMPKSIRTVGEAPRGKYNRLIQPIIIMKNRCFCNLNKDLRCSSSFINSIIFTFCRKDIGVVSQKLIHSASNFAKKQL